MAQKGNAVHRRVLLRFSDASNRIRAWIPLFKTPESAVAPVPLDEPADDTFSDDEDDKDEDGASSLHDAVAGGRIGLKDATGVVHRLAARLAAAHRSGSLQRLFEYSKATENSSLVFCTVFLPDGAALRQFQGPACADQTTARRSACLGLCSRLQQLGELDYRLFPLRRAPWQVSEQQNVVPDTALEDGDPGVRRYPRHAVMFWDHAQRDDFLYPTVVSIDGDDELHLPRRPMLLLTRTALPPVEQFNLFFDGHAAPVRLQAAGPPLQLSAEHLQLLHAYTLRIARSLANKAVTCALENMPYFLSPWQASFSLDGQSITDHIPWDTEITAASTGYVTTIPEQEFRMSESNLRDIVLQDRWSEFTRRFRGFAIRHDMTPHSKPPLDAVC